MAVQLGVVVGLLVGFGAHAFVPGSATVAWLVENVTQPVGTLYLRAVLMAIIPLIVTSLILAISSLEQSHQGGRVGMRTLLAFVALAVLGASIGLGVGNALLSNAALSPQERDALTASPVHREEPDTAPVETTSWVEIIPVNPIAAAAEGNIVALMVFTALFAVALSRLAREDSAHVLRAARAVHDATTIMVHFALRLAPIGVGALTFSVAATLGLDLLGRFGVYVLAVFVGLAILHFGCYIPAAMCIGRMSPATFVRGSWLPMTTAFATASSAATLPVNLRAAREVYGVPASIAEFVLPLGAMMSRPGTALFEAVSIVFLAQAFGVPLGPSQQLLTLALCSATAVLAAGIPGGSLPLLAAVLPTVGIPAEAIGLITAVDPITGMMRTVPNVTGSLLVSTLIRPRRPRPSERPLTELAS